MESWHSGSDLSWELAGLGLPDESKRQLSGGLKENEVINHYMVIFERPTYISTIYNI